ncbi:hypothetical protein GCM10009844_03930 [Nocardioides koreensis]|uniref:DUF2249 domain-containing protein n=1 Tax=Nocardioides koreensis TaxID=433651 RepID=A0ABN2Z5K0_9ACTN
MNDVVIASNEADARAAEAVEHHHAEMTGALTLAVESLTAAAGGGQVAAAAERRLDLVRWCREELVPHALAEETTMYAAAAEMPEARLLVEAMLAEHRAIVALVDELAATSEPVAASGLGRAVRAVFEVHLAKENEQVLPLLVAAPGVSVADLLGGMHELLGGGASGASGAEHGAPDAGHRSGGHECTCGEADDAGLPELDARAIPHAIRHATVFGALDGVRNGQGLVLRVSHDPLPLLGQLEQRSPGAFEVDYLDRGPDVWRLRLMRKAG